ncbi:MAG: hypothetical protein M0Q37_06545, partial [Sphaerochaeta sp.]|nr:hypothetical protein [Sphaerochaeta sp.]
VYSSNGSTIGADSQIRESNKPSVEALPRIVQHTFCYLSNSFCREFIKNAGNSHSTMIHARDEED